MPQLSSSERAQVEAARCQAIAHFRGELDKGHHPDVYTKAGMPTPEVARKLHDALFA